MEVKPWSIQVGTKDVDQIRFFLLQKGANFALAVIGIYGCRPVQTLERLEGLSTNSDDVQFEEVRQSHHRYEQMWYFSRQREV